MEAKQDRQPQRRSLLSTAQSMATHELSASAALHPQARYISAASHKIDRADCSRSAEVSLPVLLRAH
jgi:hypothetical protein